MKNILYLFGVLTFMLTSCSSDDSSSDSNVNTTIKPTKMVILNGNNSVLYVKDIKYDGNKIVSATDDDGYVTKYTYTGNEITKIEEFQSFTRLEWTTEYKYLNGKVVTEIRKKADESWSMEIKYTYNTDGTVSFDGNGINLPPGWTSKVAGRYTYKNGNMVKHERIIEGEVEGFSLFEYDSKKSPMSNVTGTNFLISKIDMSRNNTTKFSTDLSDVEKTYSYLYNDYDFPTEEKQFDKSGKLESIVQYTYE